MEKLNLDRKNLRKFGITMGIAFLVITLFILIRHRSSILPASFISLIFFASAFGMPVLLKPIYIIWMRFAFMLSWINTRLILIIIFYLIFTPVGLIIRLFGFDLLDRRIERDKYSYWTKKDKKIFYPSTSSYEKQF
jgi:uncharacterized protein involved in cysteine biosynthesis